MAVAVIAAEAEARMVAVLVAAITVVVGGTLIRAAAAEATHIRVAAAADITANRRCLAFGI